MFQVGILCREIILEIFCPTAISLKIREFLNNTGSSFGGHGSLVSNICAIEGLVEGDIDDEGMEAVEGETEAEGPLPATEGETEGEAEGEAELPPPEGDNDGERDGETLPPNDGLTEGDTELPPPVDGETLGDTELPPPVDGETLGDTELPPPVDGETEEDIDGL